MGLWSEIKATLKGTSTNTTLEESLTKAPQQLAVYKIFLKGSLKYIGISKKGLNRDLKNFYNGQNQSDEINQKIYENKEKITVSWRVFKTFAEAEAVYKKDLKRYKTEWNNKEKTES